MKFYIYGLFLIVFIVMLFTACKKSTEEQMKEYVEFYYPATGQYSYDIVFDWGSYLITTGAGADEELHADSEPYRGYITMRPQISQSSQIQNLQIYLITPQGEVWTISADTDIAESKSRREVTEEKTDYGTSTMTSTIESPLEPVVDHFKANKNLWKKYGLLESANGKYSLRMAQ